MIDTLIISGGSTKGISLIGSFKYLFDKNIIDYNNIKHIISLSVGSIIALPLVLKMNLKLFYNLYNQIPSIINPDEYNLNSLFTELGFFKQDELKNCIELFLKLSNINKSNITLKELYNYSKIKFTIKVTNITDNKIEYINYKNYPDMDIITLILMTTCIPIIFKPIKYNNKLYVDGGLGGCLPLEYNKSKNYLAFYISDCSNNKDINNIFDYLRRIYYIYGHSEVMGAFMKKKKRIIKLELNKSMFNLKLSKKENEFFFIQGYLQTEDFILNNKLFNY